jgi:hypothetical protein
MTTVPLGLALAGAAFMPQHAFAQNNHGSADANGGSANGGNGGSANGGTGGTGGCNGSSC